MNRLQACMAASLFAFTLATPALSVGTEPQGNEAGEQTQASLKIYPWRICRQRARLLQADVASSYRTPPPTAICWLHSVPGVIAWPHSPNQIG